MIVLIIVVLVIKLVECQTDIYSNTESSLSLYPRPYYYQEQTGNKLTIKPCNAFNCATCYYDLVDTKVKCFNCLDGYYMSSTFECKPCLDEQVGAAKLCAKCTGGKLTDCYETVSTYYYDMYEAGEDSNGIKLQKITKCPQPNVNIQMTGCKECLYCYDCELPNKKKKMACSECISGFTLNSDTNECELISDINCLEFYVNDIYSCKKCKEGYSLISTLSTLTNKKQLVCEACLVTNCKNCDTADPQSCLQCKNGYFLEQIVPVPTDVTVPKSTCSAFRDMVNDANNNRVVYDTKGYYTEDDHNTICNTPYFISTNKFCLSCNTGYSKVKVKNNDQSCGNLLSCKKIKSQMITEQLNDFMNCLECNDGYLRYKVTSYTYRIKGISDPFTIKSQIGTCSIYEDIKNSNNELMYPGSQTCPEGCKTCLYNTDIASTSIECETCYDNYYLSTDKSCTRCSANCQTCTSATICLTCYAPYHSDLNNQCKLCKTGCAECYIAKTVAQQQQICQKCMLEYHHQIKPGSTNQCLKDGTGFKCDPLGGQLRHFSSRSNKCFDCAVNKCSKCDNFRYDCSTCDSQMFSLKQPFYWKGIVQETNICRTLETNLPYCKYGTNEQCVECIRVPNDDNSRSYRFDIQQFKCLKNCNVGQYEVRKQGNDLDGTTFYQDMCLTCMDNCKSCSYNSYTTFPQCQICNKGYYLLLGYCQLCPAQCTECKSEMFCTACQSEFDVYQNPILNIRFCGKDEAGYEINDDKYLAAVNYSPCLLNCNGVCAPGYFTYEQNCHSQCPYKTIKNYKQGTCDVTTSYKIVQILPTIEEFSPFTQTIFNLENDCKSIQSQQWSIYKYNTTTNQYEVFKLIDTVDDVYSLNKISISGNNLDPSLKYKLQVDAECIYPDGTVKYEVDYIEFRRSENYHTAGQLSIKGVDQQIVYNIKIQLNMMTSEDSFTLQYSQFNKYYYEVILYYVTIFSGIVDPNFDYNKIYDTNDNQNITVDKILYSNYFQTNDNEMQYKLPPLHGFEEKKDLYIELKMTGYKQYGGYIKYSKFTFQTKNNPIPFVDQYEIDTNKGENINSDFRGFYLYQMTKYWVDKYRYSNIDNDNQSLQKDSNYGFITNTYNQFEKLSKSMNETNTPMHIPTFMQMLMIYNQIMSYTELSNYELFTKNMNLISNMYSNNKTNNINQVTFLNYFGFYQQILVNFEKITKEEKNRVNLYLMQQQQIIILLLNLIRNNQRIYQIQLFQVGNSKSIICLSSLLFNSQQNKEGLTLKSPKMCENNKNVDSSDQINQFQSQSQIILPKLSYLADANDTRNFQFQALLMNINNNIFINIQDNPKQLLESAIVFVGLYNISG